MGWLVNLEGNYREKRGGLKNQRSKKEKPCRNAKLKGFVNGHTHTHMCTPGVIIIIMGENRGKEKLLEKLLKWP